MVEVSTTLLNLDHENAIRILYDLEVAKTDYFHIDVMDGKFVPKDTSTFMKEYCEYLNSISNLPLDVHLMVNDIKSYVDSYLVYEPNIITFHYEACKGKEQVYEYIKYIKERNCKVGLAISPETSENEILEFLPYIHMLLVMTVVPGEGGQTLIPDMIEKARRVKNYLEENNIDIDLQADGGVNPSNAKALKEAGINILVAGTAILKSGNYAEVIEKLKKE